MPRPRVNEKSKNFSEAIKRLLSDLKSWKVLMILSLVLALFSSVLALIAPDRLSSFTDEISKSLVPNTKAIEEINSQMFSGFTEENMMKYAYVNPDVDAMTLEKVKLLTDLEKLKNDKNEIFNLEDSTYRMFFKDINYKGNIISVDDQIKVVHLYRNADMKDESKMAGLIANLPKSYQNVINVKVNKSKCKNIVILLGSLYLISAVFSFVQAFSMTIISNSFAKGLRSRISKKINLLPLRYFDSHEKGDLLSRLTNDVDTISQNLNNSLATIVSSGALFIGSIIMMFYTNWIMAITAILSSLLGFGSMGMILGKSQKYFAASQKSLGDLNGFIEEVYSGHNVVKCSNATEESIKKFEEYNYNLYEAKRKSIFMSGTMQPIMMFIGNLGYVAVCIVGAILAMNDIITFGVIVAFMVYVRLFTNPLSQIAQAMTQLQSSAAASERVYEFLDEEEMSNQEDIHTSLDIDNVKGDIEFEHVKFGYDESKIIVKDFNAKALNGEKIAIVGPTGAGKTTMVNLLMKFYEVNDGHIYIDGVSTNELTRENVHDLFCMVLQDTWLFNGTIRDNIRFNNETISDDQIWEALRVVGIEHFVRTLPGGLDYVLSSDSDTVSSGQKQLFTIARGMIKKSPFLILDEATSNVDTRTEELVQKAMDKLTKGKTSFIIAHRLSTIKNADLILVMKDGNIIETGNHEELMMANGFYADLYNSQFRR